MMEPTVEEQEQQHKTMEEEEEDAVAAATAAAVAESLVGELEHVTEKHEQEVEEMNHNSLLLELGGRPTEGGDVTSTAAANSHSQKSQPTDMDPLPDNAGTSKR